MRPHPHEGAAELERAVRAVHASAFAWALTCCPGDREAAEEVLQESYAKVLSGRARFDGRSRFETWLFGVIRMTAREHRRSGARRLSSLARFREGKTERDTLPPDEKVAEAARARALREALGRLPDRQREVLHLVFYEGLTVEEAAKVMDVSIGSARTHYHRAKQALRAHLSPLEGATETSTRTAT